MPQALYRKYRSRSLDDLVGQDHVTGVLRAAIAKGKISHAYLLTGPRGVGKTSIARILAHEINGLAYEDDALDLDIVEIDAASNRRIDDIRDLRDKVHIAPSRSKYKVYIIDEVHMLTGESFNALLKTLEEPPAHVVFILATTEVDKLPATILSRTQRFHFRRITPQVMRDRLRYVADKEGIAVDDEALTHIVAHSDGALRDAVNALDQLAAAGEGKIDGAAARAALGGVADETVDGLLAAVGSREAAKIGPLLDAYADEGGNPVSLTNALIRSIQGAAETTQAQLGLLDTLLDVPKSYSPAVKLYAVLMRAALPQDMPVKTVALRSPSVVVTEQSAVKADAEKTEKPAGKEQPETADKAPAESAAPKVLVAPPADFDWDTLVEHARKNYIVLHSVLHKCGHEYKDGELTLYTKFKLHKTKLDDAKYSTMLNSALKELTGGDVAVSIVFGPKPIGDETAASVASLMGGGENYEENVSVG